MNFFAPGIPKGQPRIRAFVRGRHAGVYTPPQADDWKACVMIAAKNELQHNHVHFDGPVNVNLVFLFPRPKSHLTGKGLLKKTAPQWHTSKPDRDNLDKAVLDILTQAGVFNDDAQVCSGMIAKRYTEADEQSGCHITIFAL